MIRAYESNRRRFRFQAGPFWLSISVWFEIQRRIRISNCNFDLNLIYFRLKSITFDLFSIYFWLKDLKWPSKCWLINRKQQFISKIWSFLTIFFYIWPIFDVNWILIQNLNPIQIVATILMDFSDNFRSQMSIKSRFKSDLKRFQTSSWLDRISLHVNPKLPSIFDFWGLIRSCSHSSMNKFEIKIYLE